MRSLPVAAVKLDELAPGSRAVHPLQLDETALGKLRDLDPSGRSRLVERVFDAFEASMQRMLPQLAAGLDPAPATADRTAGLRLIAHTLKSSAATIGALSMARQCAELEALLRDAPSGLAGTAGRIADLLAEMDRVQLAMQALRPAARRSADQPA